MDKEDLFGADNAPVEDVQVENAAPEPVEAPAEQAQEPVEAPQASLEPPVVEVKPDPGFVPITVVLDEREKRKAEEAQRKALEQQLAAIRAQQPQEAPDRWADPEAYEAHVARQYEQARFQDRLYFSEQLASIRHGEDIVKAAREWGFDRCNTDPLFNAKILQSNDPMGVVVAEYQRDQIASKVTLDDYKQFEAWKAAQAALAAQAPVANPTPEAPPIPSPSLASAPSAGGSKPPKMTAEEERLSSMF